MGRFFFERVFPSFNRIKEYLFRPFFRFSLFRNAATKRIKPKNWTKNLILYIAIKLGKTRSGLQKKHERFVISFF